jgi:hypothetical protein
MRIELNSNFFDLLNICFTHELLQSAETRSSLSLKHLKLRNHNRVTRLGEFSPLKHPKGHKKDLDRTSTLGTCLKTFISVKS